MNLSEVVFLFTGDQKSDDIYFCSWLYFILEAVCARAVSSCTVNKEIPAWKLCGTVFFLGTTSFTGPVLGLRV